MKIDFSAAVDGVNYPGILVKLCSVGIGGSVLVFCFCFCVLFTTVVAVQRPS